MSWTFFSPSPLAAPGPSVLTRTTAGVDVASTVSETSLFNYSVPAGIMGTTRALRLTLIGDWLYNNNIADTFTLRAKFGGTTQYAETTGGAPIGATRQPWVLTLYIANLNAANSQYVGGHLLSGRETLAASTGIGNMSMLDAGSATNNLNPTGGVIGITTLGSIDTAAAATLDITAQWSASSANDSWRMRYGVLEVV